MLCCYDSFNNIQLLCVGSPNLWVPAIQFVVFGIQWKLDLTLLETSSCINSWIFMFVSAISSNICVDQKLVLLWAYYHEIIFNLHIVCCNFRKFIGHKGHHKDSRFWPCSGNLFTPTVHWIRFYSLVHLTFFYLKLYPIVVLHILTFQCIHMC